jgi:putative N6-adenine-specific DNA methylase
LLAQELGAIGASDARVTAGGVGFSGSWETCYRANLWSRLASRVLWRVGKFEYASEDDIYAAARAVHWFDLFDVNRTLRVYVTAHKSPVKSLEFVTLRVKDAVCDRFRDDVGRRPDVDRANPDVRVHLFLGEKDGSLYLDTSGEALFKRGWRMETVEAPLRENLAAGILMLTGWQFEQPLLDPMCGGATLLVEAAAMARGRAPGMKRAFGFEKLDAFNGALWKQLREEAAQPAKHAPKLALFGSDADAKVLGAARRNLAAAGVERWVTLEAVDLLRRKSPAASGVMIANPPYGERIGEAEELAEWYPLLGDWLKKNFSGWEAWIISGDPLLPKLLGLKASRRIPLFNGPIETRFLQYKLIAGSMRDKKPAVPAD